MRCGDHGIFCRRAAFIDIGGFPAVPIMEDENFFAGLLWSQRMGKKRILVSPSPIRSTWSHSNT